VKEGSIHINFSLMPYQQAAIITKPSEGSFNFPTLTVTSEFSSILHFRLFSVVAMWNDKINFKLFEPFSKWITVIAFVTYKSQRTLFRAATAIARHFYRFKGLFGERDFCGRCRGKGASQRNTLAVDHHHPLRSFAPFGRPNSGPPFFAGAKLPSIKASCQSSAPFSSSMDKNLRQTSSQTPCSSQSLSRRQQVEALGYRSGRSCHRAPVRSTQRIPSSTSRFSIGGRPPLALRLALGSNGSSSFHWSFIIKPVYLAIEHLPIA
jgi:hypothetical protein